MSEPATIAHVCTVECWQHMIRTGLRLDPECTSAAARLAAEGVESDTDTGGWRFDGEKGWLLDADQKERVRGVHEAAMARVDEAHADLPRCALCGQQERRLDEFGLCSKVSKPHQAWRDEARVTSPVRFR